MIYSIHNEFPVIGLPLGNELRNPNGRAFMNSDVDNKITNRKKQLISYFKTIKVAKSSTVFEAFMKVPREEFILPSQKPNAYDDRPLPILENQTISAPHMCVMLLEAIWPNVIEFPYGDKVLEIGTGSGYQSALLAEMVSPLSKPREDWGHVYTIERFRHLVEFARKNHDRTGYTERVTIHEGDGTLGYPEEAPYDHILVTAASPDVPEPLITQLKEGGRLVVPVGKRRFNQTLMVVHKKKGGKLVTKKIGGVAFVPLVGKYGWKK